MSTCMLLFFFFIFVSAKGAGDAWQGIYSETDANHGVGKTSSPRGARGVQPMRAERDQQPTKAEAKKIMSARVIHTASELAPARPVGG